jgi:hypothetical protein
LIIDCKSTIYIIMNSPLHCAKKDWEKSLQRYYS